MSTEYYLDAVSGNGPSGEYSIALHGRNAAVSTSYVPVSVGGVYQTPQVASGTKLRVKAGNTNDTAAGSGARKIFLSGVTTTGEHVYEELATAGTSASADSVNTYIRLIQAGVAASGSYATISAGSHAADILIENAAGGTTWGTISSTGYPRGVTEIGAYTVPAGKQAYIMSIHYAFDTAQTLSLLLFQRDGILKTSAPYSPMNQIFTMTTGALVGEQSFQIPPGPFGPLTDLGTLAKMSSSTSEVHVSLEILVRNQE